MSNKHPQVLHPTDLERDIESSVGKTNDWLASHLAIVFGAVWTVWLFFIVPLVAYFLPSHAQATIFFFSSGWIQLFALPLFVYIGNKLQKSTDLQSDAQHQALTHIALIEDQNNKLLAQNTKLTEEIHKLTVGGNA